MTDINTYTYIITMIFPTPIFSLEKSEQQSSAAWKHRVELGAF